jgi:tetratricopeptide (TPR) repeat protein
MDSATSLERLQRTSRASAILMALGAMVVLMALWWSAGQLRNLQTEVTALDGEAGRLRTQNSDLRQQAEAMRAEIRGLREALTASRDAIIAFHQRDYARAVTLYDQALRADPKNAYLLNLKAYALFKLKRFSDAVAVQEESIRVDPSYAWGYFDLARFQCAAARAAASEATRVAHFQDARKAIKMALEGRPGLRSTMEQDGEFQGLCATVLR